MVIHGFFDVGGFFLFSYLSAAEMMTDVDKC
jgi:hypothetical protein